MFNNNYLKIQKLFENIKYTNIKKKQILPQRNFFLKVVLANLLNFIQNNFNNIFFYCEKLFSTFTIY